jgi:hypothetical protein
MRAGFLKKQNLNFEKSQAIRKIEKPVAMLSYGLH